MSLGQRYAVTVISSHGNMPCFREVGESLVHGLRVLGDDPPDLLWETYAKPPRVSIVIGWNVLPTPDGSRVPPPGSILYNLEQLRDGNPNCIHADRYLLDPVYDIADYNHQNLRWLVARGRKAHYLPIGYAGSSFAGAGESGIDVCFVGYMNDRRLAIRDALWRRGLSFHHIQGVYGAERNAAVRARVCLNLHWFAGGLFEEVRVSHLLANARCVVSENGDPEAEAPYQGGVLFADYNGLADMCVLAARDEKLRQGIRARGLEIMRSRPVEGFLGPMLRAVEEGRS